MTNTSEPHSDDMVQQAENPVDFDWMMKGICGLRNVPAMMDAVERNQPFGSFFALAELAETCAIAVAPGRDSTLPSSSPMTVI